MPEPDRPPPARERLEWALGELREKRWRGHDNWRPLSAFGGLAVVAGTDMGTIIETMMTVTKAVRVAEGLEREADPGFAELVADAERWARVLDKRAGPVSSRRHPISADDARDLATLLRALAGRLEGR